MKEYATETIFRLFFFKELFDFILTGEVQFRMGTGEEVGVAFSLEFAHDSGAYHAAMTCDVYL